MTDYCLFTSISRELAYAFGLTDVAQIEVRFLDSALSNEPIEELKRSATHNYKRRVDIGFPINLIASTNVCSHYADPFRNFLFCFIVLPTLLPVLPGRS